MTTNDTSPPDELSDLKAELAGALARLAGTEERATRLAHELDVAEQKIADLEDFAPRGNTDPLLQRVGVLKAKIGRTGAGSRLATLYRKVINA